MTALTAYLTSTNDTLLTTARQLSSSAPAAATTASSGQFAKSATGYSELYSQGGNATLAGTEPTASGHGFLFDATTLEGQQMAAGTWSVTITLSAVAAGFTVTPIVRVWKRSSAGSYTQFTSGGVATDLVGAASWALTTSAVTHTITGSLDAMSFATGDKLYIDMLVNITTGSASNTATNRVIVLTENGGANEAATTPGYTLIPAVALQGVSRSGARSFCIALGSGVSLVAQSQPAVAQPGQLQPTDLGITPGSGVPPAVRSQPGMAQPGQLQTTALAVATAPTEAFQGVSQSGSRSTGTLSVALPFQGASRSGSRATGTLSERAPLQGLGRSGSRSTGTLSIVDALVGVSRAGSRSVATLSTREALQGVSRGGSRSTGTLSVAEALQGVARTGSRSTGTLTSTVSLAGRSVTGSRSIGTLADAVPLAGQSRTGSRSTGTLRQQPAVRQLGGIIVTTSDVLRPSGLAHTRTLGGVTVTGRAILPGGLARVGALGTPTLYARILPTGLAHDRMLEAPAVNPLKPAGLAHTRGIGSHTLTTVANLRLVSLDHAARNLGSPVAHGRAILTPTALAHTRGLGNPALSARILPNGLARNRMLGTPEINVVVLHILALDRA